MPIAYPEEMTPEELRRAQADAEIGQEISADELGAHKAKAEAFNPLESAGLGAAYWGSGGTSPYIEGAVRGGYNALDEKKSFLDEYRKARDAAIARDQKAYNDNPWSYGLAGAGAALVNPLGRALGAVSPALAPGTVAGAVAQGGIMGGAVSRGDLTKGEIGEFGGDVALGAGIGGSLQKAVPAALDWVGNKAVPWVAKKATSTFFNVPEEFADYYQQAIRSGRDMTKGPKPYQVSEAVHQDMEKLRNDSIQGSLAANANLEAEGTQIDPNRVADTYRRYKENIARKNMGINTDEDITGTIGALGAKEKAWRDYGKPEVKTSSILDELGKPYTTIIPGKESIPAARLKQEIQTLDKKADYSTNAARGIPTLDERTAKMIRGENDAYLKSESPAYAEMMQQVAKDADLQHRMSEFIPSKSTGVNVYKRVSRDKYGTGQIPAKTLREFDERMGSNHLQNAADAWMTQTLENPRATGSKMTNTFKSIGKAVAGSPGEAAGAVAGAGLDYLKSPFITLTLKSAAKLSKVLTTEGRDAFLKEAHPIMQAAAQGDKSAALTLYLLQRRFPDAFKPQQGNQ